MKTHRYCDPVTLNHLIELKKENEELRKDNRLLLQHNQMLEAMLTKEIVKQTADVWAKSILEGSAMNFSFETKYKEKE